MTCSEVLDESASAAAPDAAPDRLPRTFEVSTRLVRVRRAQRIALSTTPPPPARAPTRRPAKLAQLLALAHHIEALIAAGDVHHRADAACRMGLTRARITQLLDLTLLAPDLQESILFAEAVEGIEPFGEREAREVLRLRSWAEQRARWRRLVPEGLTSRA